MKWKAALLHEYIFAFCDKEQMHNQVVEKFLFALTGAETRVKAGSGEKQESRI